MDVTTSKRPCWKCGQLTAIVITGVRFLTDQEVGDKLQQQYPFFYLDFSKEGEGAYYVNHCEHCGVIQGDLLLFVDQLLEKGTERDTPTPIDPTPKKYSQTSLDDFF